MSQSKVITSADIASFEIQIILDTSLGMPFAKAISKASSVLTRNYGVNPAKTILDSGLVESGNFNLDTIVLELTKAYIDSASYEVYTVQEVIDWLVIQQVSSVLGGL